MLFKEAMASEMGGWRYLSLTRKRLRKKFRDEKGTYQYGLFKLDAKTFEELEHELVEDDPHTTIHFAIIDVSEIIRPEALIQAMRPAMRLDPDFYVFTGGTDKQHSDFQSYLESIDFIPVLCLSTPLKEKGGDA